MSEEFIIDYVPSLEDNHHMDEIRDFFNDEGIPYEEVDLIYGLFHLNDKKVQLRYVSSIHFPMDNERRFGSIGRGIPHNYFIDISHRNADNDIRTIWCFDFEMEQCNDIVIDGKLVHGYRRQW